jgi:hypothetical protein
MVSVKLLAKIHRKHMEKSPIGTEATRGQIHDLHLGLLSKYSLAVYGPRWCKILGLLPFSSDVNSHEECVRYFARTDFIEASQWAAEIFRPAYFIALDHKSNSIIFSIRGSVSLHDSLMNLTCDPVPFAHGQVHRGFFEAAKKVSDEVKEKILHLLSVLPDYALIITGHSLGAAVGAMVTMLWNYESKQGDANVPKVHKCVGFASPCLASRDLCESDLSVNITSIVIGYDIVSRLSKWNTSPNLD